MKKMMIALLFAAVSVSLAACGSGSDSENTEADSGVSVMEDSSVGEAESEGTDSDLEKESEAKGKTDDAEITVETYYDPDGNPIEYVMVTEAISEEYSSSTPKYNYEYEFDQDGRMTEKAKYYDMMPIESEQYEYDSDGRLLKKTEETMSYDVTWEYEYDGDGRRTEAVIHGSSSDSVVTYEYDGNNNLIRSTTSYSDGYPDYVIEYEYDESGNLIKETYPNTYSGISDIYREYQYDSNGNQVQFVEYWIPQLEDKYMPFMQVENTYDETGNLVKSVTTALGDMSTFGASQADLTPGTAEYEYLTIADYLSK